MTAEHLTAIRDQVGKRIVVAANGWYFCEADKADGMGGPNGKWPMTTNILKAKGFGPLDSDTPEFFARVLGGHVTTFTGV